MSEPIGLAELITKIKDELKQAQESDKVFIIDKIELEVKVGVLKTDQQQQDVQGKIGLQLQVIPFLPFAKVGADASVEGTESIEVARENVHTVKLSLSPAFLNEKFMDTLSEEQKQRLKKRNEQILFRGDNAEDKF